MATREYILYEINLKITKCGPLEEITLNTCARRPIEHIIRLSNPIKNPVIFKLKGNCPDLSFPKLVNLDPYSEIELHVIYKPMFPTTSPVTANLDIKSSTMGMFPYTFVLNCDPAVPEPPVHVEAQLGLTGRKTVIFNNMSPTKGTFTASFANPEFSLDGGQIAVEPKQKIPFDVIFEPSNLGGMQSMLTLTSPTLGEFKYPLIGNGIEPKPKGPFLIKSNAVTHIPFKNPFAEPKMFLYSVESSVFNVKIESELLKPKAQTKIPIAHTVDTANNEYNFTSKLMVRCEDVNFAEIKWIIYLHSEVEQQKK